MVSRSGTRRRHPFRMTAMTPPMNPPYQTSPPREKSAADDPGHNDIGRVVLVEPAATELALHGPTCQQKPGHHHQSVAGDGEGTEFEDQRVERHRVLRPSRVATAGSRPGRGRLARASR